MPPADRTASPPAHNNGNWSATASGFNQLRNEFLTVARRVATTKKQAIAEIVEWASGGAFKYGDVGRMTEADASRLRAAVELMSSAAATTVR
jgi:rRNA maturation endonuclease Nob1